MELSKTEAETVLMALNSFAITLASERDKIAHSETTVSEFIVQAAYRQYNELVEPLSQLQIKINNEYPQQPAVTVA
jgi:hypothetical protein